ncbi:MAG: fatty acid desaturase [Cognaticolwellia sp.]|jgi:fatty acid desaturase
MKRAQMTARPGLTLLLGITLLISAMSSAVQWMQGGISLIEHLGTTIPMLYFLFICIHDGVHSVLSGSRWVNDAAATLLAGAVGLPFALLRHAHLHHHAHLGQPSDPEGRIYNSSIWELPMTLLAVPFIYLVQLPKLGWKSAAAVCIQLTLLVSAMTLFPSLLTAWALPVLLGVLYFGFTTVYAPHSRHHGRLMPWLNLHSGYHHDHHRDPRYPFHQYFQLRLDGLLNQGVAPSFTQERKTLSLVTIDLRTLAPSVRAHGNGAS